MKLKSLSAIAVAVLANMACEKDKTPADSCNFGMENYYYVNVPAEKTDTVNFASNVSNGVWRLGPDTLTGNYWTTLHFKNVARGACNLYPIDTAQYVSMEVMLQNPTTGEGSVPAHDVQLQIVGENKTASVVIVSNTRHIASTSLTVDTVGVKGSLALIRSFDTLTKVTLTANGSVLSLHINDEFVLSTTYAPATLGKIKDFVVRFKGSGTVDYIRVYDASGRVQLRNEFTNPTGEYNGIEFLN
jgi:hypothetical protein